MSSSESQPQDMVIDEQQAAAPVPAPTKKASVPRKRKAAAQDEEAPAKEKKPRAPRKPSATDKAPKLKRTLDRPKKTADKTTAKEAENGKVAKKRRVKAEVAADAEESAEPVAKAPRKPRILTKPTDVPKRPFNQYSRFVRAHKDEFQKNNPDLDMVQVNKYFAGKWRTMTEEQKLPYRDEYLIACEEYKRTLEAMDPKKVRNMRAYQRQRRQQRRANLPKQPVSAYIEWVRSLKKGVELPAQITFVEQGKLQGSLWKALPVDQKQVYLDRYQQERDSYKAQMKAHKDKVKSDRETRRQEREQKKQARAAKAAEQQQQQSEVLASA